MNIDQGLAKNLEIQKLCMVLESRTSTNLRKECHMKKTSSNLQNCIVKGYGKDNSENDRQTPYHQPIKHHSDLTQKPVYY